MPMLAPHSSPRPTNRPGFTLIELLLVCVIIGVLSAIAIPKFRSTKDRAMRAGLASDLRNLATWQESYFEEHAAYADDVTKLTFRGSSGNLIKIEETTPQGWSATAKHPAVSGQCGVAYGDANTVIAGAATNQVKCVE